MAVANVSSSAAAALLCNIAARRWKAAAERESCRPPAVSSDPDKSLPASRGPVLVLSQLSPSATNKQTNSCRRRCGGGRPRVLGQWAAPLAGAEHKAGATASELINWVNSSPSSCFSMLTNDQTDRSTATNPSFHLSSVVATSGPGGMEFWAGGVPWGGGRGTCLPGAWASGGQDRDRGWLPPPGSLHCSDCLPGSGAPTDLNMHLVFGH